MLRFYNKTIKVRVFLIDSKQTKIDKYANKLNIEVIHRPATKHAKEQKYFCLNRQYLSECNEDSILYIDGDTFIFGDIETIFDRYQNVDFAGAIDEYIINSTDWDQNNYDLCSKVPIFNGGLTLWNNCVKKWTDSIADVCTRLQNKEFPITPWLFGNNRNCYHKETFSICFCVSDNKLKYSIMDRKDVVNLFSMNDYNAWNKKDFIVYHVFNQNWDRFYRDLIPHKKIVSHKVYIPS